MKVHLVGKNIELTDAIKDHLSHKINKKFQRLNPTAQLRVSLCVEKKRHIAHAVYKTNGVVIYADDETADLYKSVNNVLNKLAKNLFKKKSRTQSCKSSWLISTNAKPNSSSICLANL